VKRRAGLARWRRAFNDALQLPSFSAKRLEQARFDQGVLARFAMAGLPDTVAEGRGVADLRAHRTTA